MNGDTARDLLFARDCIDAGRCAIAGPKSSFAGLQLGAVWVHLLEIGRLAGIGLGGVRAIVLSAQAAAAVFVYFAPRRLCGWASGPMAWALYLAASVASIELPMLWNPSLLPLPLALFYVCVASLAARGRVAAAVAAGAGLALAVDAHVVCAALVPFLLGAVVATADRPLLAVPAAALALAATSFGSSAGSVLADLPVILAAAAPCGILVLGTLVLGLALRSRVRARAPVGRARAVLAAACVYLGAVILAVRVLTRHAIAPRYLAPIVPPLAILAGALATLLLVRFVPRRRGAAASRTLALIVAAAFLLDLRRPAARRGRLAWTLLDAEALGPALAAGGWSFADLFRHLRGPDAHQLLLNLAPHLPPPGAPWAHDAPSDDLLVVKTLRARLPDAVPPAWILTNLPDGAIAVARRGPSWLDTSSFQVCAGRPGGEPRCIEADPTAEDPDRAGTGLVGQRAFRLPRFVGDLFANDDARRGPLRWTVALRLAPTADGPPRTLEIVEPTMPWAIARVEGARSREPLPAREVTLERGAGEGSVLFAVDVPAADADRFWPWFPCLVETSADEAALRDLLDGRPR